MPLSAFSSDIFFPLFVTRSVNYSPARCTAAETTELMLIMIDLPDLALDLSG
jgi:hypothetical protein